MKIILVVRVPPAAVPPKDAEAIVKGQGGRAARGRLGRARGINLDASVILLERRQTRARAMQCVGVWGSSRADRRPVSHRVTHRWAGATTTDSSRVALTLARFFPSPPPRADLLRASPCSSTSRAGNVVHTSR